MKNIIKQALEEENSFWAYVIVFGLCISTFFIFFVTGIFFVYFKFKKNLKYLYLFFLGVIACIMLFFAFIKHRRASYD